MRTAYVVFIEDTPKFLWQLEVFLYSITTNAEIPEQDIFVFWATPDYYGSLDKTQDPAKTSKSIWLNDILNTYPRVKHYYSQNFGRQNRCYRFFDQNEGWHGISFVGINKWASWIEWCNAGIFNDYKFVIILEQDLWFYNKFPYLPDKTCVTYNWIPNRKKSFSLGENEPLDKWAKARGIETSKFSGFDLDDIMRMCNFTDENRDKWVQGAVIFKFETDILKPKLLNDIMNFTYLLLHIGEICHPSGIIYVADMVSPCLALANSGIEVDVVRTEEWETGTWTDVKIYKMYNDIPKDTVVHYGWDFRMSKFLGINDNGLEFYKNEFTSAPWDNIQLLQKLIDESRYYWCRKFFSDMLKIKEKYPNLNRICDKPVKSIRL